MRIKRILLGAVIITLIFIGLFFLSSCKNNKTRYEKITMYVISRSYNPPHDEFTYHWGYSVWNGKYCWHWGNEHFNAEYHVTASNNTETVGLNNQDAYKNYAVGDSIIMTKKVILNEDSTKILHEIIYYK